MGLYTYDCDLTINWNDPYRKTKTDVKSRLAFAAKKALKLKQQQQGASAALRRQSARPNSALIAAQPIGSIASAGDDSSDGDTSSKPSRKASRDRSNDLNLLTTSGSGASISTGPPLSVAAARRRASNFGHGGIPMGGGLPQIPSLQEVDETDPEAAELDAQKAVDKSKESPTIVVPPYTQQVWTDDQDLVDLRHMITDSIRLLWDKGIEAYIAGHWSTAKEIFEETLRLTKGKDGPSKQLLGYMGDHGNVAPKGWKGYRMDEDGGH